MLNSQKSKDMDKQKKTLGKLKLNQLSKNELDKRAMKVIKGGCGCQAACNMYSPSASSLEAEGYYGY